MSETSSNNALEQCASDSLWAANSSTANNNKQSPHQPVPPTTIAATLNANESFSLNTMPCSAFGASSGNASQSNAYFLQFCLLLEPHVTKHQLQQYVSSLISQNCDTAEVLGTLTTQEFQAMGFTIGHSKRAIMAIQQVRDPTGADRSVVQPLASPQPRGASPTPRSTDNASYGLNNSTQSHQASTSEGAVPLGTSGGSMRDILGNNSASTTSSPRLATTLLPKRHSVGAIAGIGRQHQPPSDDKLPQHHRSSSNALLGPLAANTTASALAMQEDDEAMSFACDDDNLFSTADLPESSMEQGFRKFANSAAEVQWEGISGFAPSLKEFLAFMRTTREKHGFPSSFDRLFLDNKPMPFVEISRGKDMFGLLVRIPDLSDDDGTSIATITNRVCFMVNLHNKAIVTFHACEEDPLEEMARDWSTGKYNHSNIEQVTENMIRRVLRTYSTGLQRLRAELDDIESGAVVLGDMQRVQKLNSIQRRSFVYKRCAEASKDAMEEIINASPALSFLRTHCDILDTVVSVADELASNALSSIDLTIALSDFRSSMNLKIFTYATILLQPVTAATSWYGMNFVYMPELEIDTSYFIFTPVVWAFSIAMCVAIYLREHYNNALLSRPKETLWTWLASFFRSDEPPTPVRGELGTNRDPNDAGREVDVPLEQEPMNHPLMIPCNDDNKDFSDLGGGDAAGKMSENSHSSIGGNHHTAVPALAESSSSRGSVGGRHQWRHVSTVVMATASIAGGLRQLD